jgi:Enoyl-(Acyl carrier protein) reductase
MGSDFEKHSLAMTPLGRIGTPADIAKVVVFLASDDSGWLTAEIILASGGLRQQGDPMPAYVVFIREKTLDRRSWKPTGPLSTRHPPFPTNRPVSRPYRVARLDS